MKKMNGGPFFLFLVSVVGKKETPVAKGGSFLGSRDQEYNAQTEKLNTYKEKLLGKEPSLNLKLVERSTGHFKMAANEAISLHLQKSKDNLFTVQELYNLRKIHMSNLRRFTAKTNALYALLDLDFEGVHIEQLSRILAEIREQFNKETSDLEFDPRDRPNTGMSNIDKYLEEQYQLAHESLVVVAVENVNKAAKYMDLFGK
jgi:hypothetical protein